MRTESSEDMDMRHMHRGWRTGRIGMVIGVLSENHHLIKFIATEHAILVGVLAIELADKGWGQPTHELLHDVDAFAHIDLSAPVGVVLIKERHCLLIVRWSFGLLLCRSWGRSYSHSLGFWREEAEKGR